MTVVSETKINQSEKPLSETNDLKKINDLKETNDVAIVTKRQSKYEEKALLLDTTYFDEDNQSTILLFCTDTKKNFWLKDKQFKPYFYVVVEEGSEERTIKEIMNYSFGEDKKVKAYRVSKTDLKYGKKIGLKVEFNTVSQLIDARKHFSDIGLEKHEYDIPFAKKYLLDKNLQPGNWISYEVIGEEKTQLELIDGNNEDEVKSEKKTQKFAHEVNEKNPEQARALNNESLGLANKISEKKFTFDYPKAKIIQKIKPFDSNFFGNGIAFDLETKVGKKFGIGVEPILMVSIVSNQLGEKNEKQLNCEKVISYGTTKIEQLQILDSEKELIKKTIEELNKPEINFIITYNGDNFDFAYLKERAKKFKIDFKINGAKIKISRKGLENAVKIFGVQHIDSYQIIKFMQRTGAVNTAKLDIESVSEKVFGEKKEKMWPKEITEAWESGDEKKLARLVDYNLKDSRVAFRIAKEFLPLFIEISKLTSQTLYDTTRSTTSQMVEDLLLKEAHLRGIIAPNKPKENEVTQRTMNPIKGAFVKEPLAGLHEKIAVLDFASLYPSIIISHNISPETLNCGHEECKKNVSPEGTYFCTKQKGLFPQILDSLLRQRLKLKKEYKRKKKEKGIDDKVLFAKQWALKIILNSVYGYLGYPRARWYSRECASATTAWERDYINDTIKKAEKAGFKVLYGDTDSTFLLMLDKTKRDVEDFVEKINSELPETMELEIDSFYKRGLFVTKKEGGAAKKRYALVDEKGNLKIVGFEYVRRDWCDLAKETQKKVLELVLTEGRPEEAAEYVKRVIKKINEGKIEKKELTIMTLLQRNPKNYDSIGPHVAAAEKAISKGKKLEAGSMLSFIITKGRKEKESISQKAELEEYVKEGDYDSQYYIENQVLPAVIKILQELGYSREDLLTGGKQTGLGSWK